MEIVGGAFRRACGHRPHPPTDQADPILPPTPRLPSSSLDAEPGGCSCVPRLVQGPCLLLVMIDS